ncbi:FecR family protein [Methylophaga sp. SB9B]|uniref:FecR family protein n=1 Tax=Methylophaga sp. SB9B TaxID=2570356 RepID=UPI0010A94681|nr:FecR family protein [Methylophaga sp. SB9B]THK42663.1 FecR family protein [Methylophaga sp. SB9B]
MAEPSHQALEQAAEWFALLRDGQASNEHKIAWHQWLDAKPENKKAWQYVEKISHSFETLQQTPDPQTTADNLFSANQRLRQRRRVLSGILSIGAIGLVGQLSWNKKWLPESIMAFSADYHTGVGQQSNITLADGSQIWLNTATAINVDYTTQHRRIQLLHGEIYIETAKDLRRSFVVDTSHGRLTALGTQFNVISQQENIELAVYEGAVSVQTNSAQQAELSAGETTRFNTNQIMPKQRAITARQAWRQGLLVAEDMTLEDLIAELNRYQYGYINISDDVAQLKVYGSFPLSDTNRALAMLTTVLPIQVRQVFPGWIKVESLRN